MVRRGRVESLREKRRDGGAKREMVPVPVLSFLTSPVSMTRLMRFGYWYSSCVALAEVAISVEVVPLRVDMTVY